jgi:predicted esterase
VLSGFLLATLVAASPATADDGRLIELVDRFYAAPTVEEAQDVADEIEALGADFEAVFRTLGKERRYPQHVPVGLVEGVRRNRDGMEHRYLLAVPETYAPGRRYPVRVLLHGGIMRPAWKKGGGWWHEPKGLLRDDRIAVVPAAWSESRWWDASQIENVAAILRDLKRVYDVDENRICQIGVSDGGTGAWFFAFKDPTPWAAFLPLIGHPGVIANPASEADGPLFAANLVGRPVLAINGSEDPLYPADSVRRLLPLFESAGAEVRLDVVQGGGHDLRFWPGRGEAIESFIADHPRDPLPERLVWATDRTDRYNRNSWVVIEELAEGDRGAPKLPTLGPSSERLGWVDVKRSANGIDVLTLGVRRLRLLLSPRELDLAEEITVTTNGRESFRGRLRPSIGTLLEWAARDMDRELLFAAELVIDVPPIR